MLLGGGGGGRGGETGEGRRAAWRPWRMDHHPSRGMADPQLGHRHIPNAPPFPLSSSPKGAAHPRSTPAWVRLLCPCRTAFSRHPGTAFVVVLAWITMALLAVCWGLSYRDDLADPRADSLVMRDRLWTLVLTFIGGLATPFLVMGVLTSYYYRLAQPLLFLIGGMLVALLINMASLIANVVVHLDANDKMRYVCYRSGVSDSTCAYSVTDEIYCGAELQSMCTVFLLGFDGMMCSLAGMVLILLCMLVHAIRQRNRMRQLMRAEEADFDLASLHINDVDT